MKNKTKQTKQRFSSTFAITARGEGSELRSETFLSNSSHEENPEVLEESKVLSSTNVQHRQNFQIHLTV